MKRICALFVRRACVQICGAFVYGAMSFSDKLSSGVAIALIQQFSPRKYVDTGRRTLYKDRTPSRRRLVKTAQLTLSSLRGRGSHSASVASAPLTFGPMASSMLHQLFRRQNCCMDHTMTKTVVHF